MLLSNAQLVTGNAMTPTQLVQNVLVGTGVTVSNITYVGAQKAIGDFNGTNSNVGLNEGIILSTGTVLNETLVATGQQRGPVGPNNNEGATTAFGEPGDADLAALVNQNTLDAAVLEFDFIPQGDTVKFSYVFASEEYPDYVGQNYNDVFAFFISGPGISGSQNIALIPGTSQPVSINNVNIGQNSSYYISNGNGATEPQKSDPTVINFNGFTVPLTAVAKVTPCETYHLKIAIADAVDDAFDSGVFLQGGSLTSVPQFEINQTASVDVGTQNLIPEGCSDGIIELTRTKELWNPLTIDFKIYGTASNGSDYNAINESVTFPANSDKAEVRIEPISDALVEGTETVIIRFPNPDICESDSFDYEFNINDLSLLNSVPDTSQLYCPGTNIDIDANFSGGYSPYNYSWSSGGNAITETVAPNSTTDYTFTVTDVCGSSTNNIHRVEVPTLSNLAINLPSDTSVRCAGETLEIIGIATGGSAPYSYSWDTGDQDSVLSISVLSSKTYTLTIEDDCNNTTSESIDVNLNYPTFSVDVLSDTTVCPGDSVEFTAVPTGGVPPYTIVWENAASTLTAKFASSTSKFVNVSVTDSCGIIPATDSVELSVQQPIANFEINAPRLETDETIYYVDNSIGSIQSYVWDLGNGESSTLSATNTSYNVDSTYGVMLTVTDSLGCQDSIVKYVKITPPLYFYIPNTFTPNGDGKNDIFIGKGVGVRSLELTVFSRWGEVLFTTKNPNEGWDGTTNGGKELPDGVYVFSLYVKGESGKEIEKMGTITLFR